MNMLIGVREHEFPSLEEFKVILDESIDKAGLREQLFDQSGLVMMPVEPSDNAGFFLCHDGVIRPRAFDGMCQSIMSDAKMVRDFSQDAMRMMLKDHGLMVKLNNKGEIDSEIKESKVSSIFFKVGFDVIQEMGAEAVYEATKKWFSQKRISKKAVVVNGVMIEPVSRVFEGSVHLHAASGDSKLLASFSAKDSLYGSKLRVEGMSDDFMEFWHLNFLLAALGTQLDLKRVSEDADVSFKTAVKMSRMYAA